MLNKLAAPFTGSPTSTWAAPTFSPTGHREPPAGVYGYGTDGEGDGCGIIGVGLRRAATRVTHFHADHHYLTATADRGQSDMPGR